MALLDSGDFSAPAGPASRVKTENLIEGMGTMGFDAVNIGEKDLAVGIAEFRELSEKSKLPFINANFIYRDNGEQLLPPYVVKEYKLPKRHSVKVGYIGVNGLNSAFAKEGPGGRVVIMRDPVDAARLHVPKLRTTVDLVVLLGNLPQRDLTTVLTEVKGIDLALVSFGPRVSPVGKLETIAGVPVLYAGDQGKRMGEVRLGFGQKGEPPEMAANHVYLTRRYPADPELQSLIDRTIARANDLNRQAVETASRAAVAAPQAGGIPPPIPRPSPVGPGKIIAPEEQKPYLTAEACAPCHGEAYDIYIQSAHAHAFDTLVKAKQDFNPECVKCHVTGFAQPQGFVNARRTPDLANVQCEACHGNAAEHVLNPGQAFGRVPPRECFTCHNKENSPDFVFFKYWDMIKH